MLNRIEKLRLKWARLIAPENTLILENYSWASGVLINEGGSKQVFDWDGINVMPGDTLDLVFNGEVHTDRGIVYAYKHRTIMTTTDPIELSVGARGGNAARTYNLVVSHA